MIPLKYLSNFWRATEMPLINCETSLILTSSAKCVMSKAATNQATTFATTHSKHCDLAVTLSTQDNAKLFQQSRSGFKRTINWNE